MNAGAMIMLQKLGLPILAVGTLLFVLSPSAALARDHGEGGHGGGFSGGGNRGFSGGGNRGFSGGGNFGNHSGGQRFSEGRSYNGGERDYSRERGYYGRGGWGDRDRYYRGGGLYFGYGAPSYHYPGSCNPAGYYDQWGNWQPYPGCYVNPYYPY
jgi:hypothetical protein